MTDRVQSLTVILDRDYRTDDVEVIVSATGQIRGVRAVELGAVVDGCDHLARIRVYHDLRAEVIKLFNPEKS